MTLDNIAKPEVICYHGIFSGDVLMDALLSVSPLQILDIWGELTDCLLHRNSYGSDVAEIYISRTMPSNPHAEIAPRNRDVLNDYCRANRALYDICRLFEERYDVTVEFEHGESIDILNLPDGGEPITHRAHLRVRPKVAAPPTKVPRGGNRQSPAQKKLREILFAIAEGAPVKASDDRYIIVENPDHQEHLGTDPCMVLDVSEFFGMVD